MRASSWDQLLNPVLALDDLAVKDPGIYRQGDSGFVLFATALTATPVDYGILLFETPDFATWTAAGEVDPEGRGGLVSADVHEDLGRPRALNQHTAACARWICSHIPSVFENVVFGAPGLMRRAVREARYAGSDDEVALAARPYRTC